MRRKLTLGLVALCLSGQTSFGQARVVPILDIWEVALGQPITQVSDADVGEITCGTNGGPPGQPIDSFSNYLTCKPEPSGLREIQFSYDDEQDYIARAMNSEFKFLRGGTSVFAHPVIVSVLIDAEGVVQGRRIVTDNRISDYERRTAVTLMRNFKARFGPWSLECADVPMKEGEQPVGNQFTHEICTGTSPDGSTRIAIEASYLRKKGQLGRNLETQAVNTGYFESQTRYEEVLLPYLPGTSP